MRLAEHEDGVVDRAPVATHQKRDARVDGGVAAQVDDPEGRAERERGEDGNGDLTPPRQCKAERIIARQRPVAESCEQGALRRQRLQAADSGVEALIGKFDALVPSSELAGLLAKLPRG